LVARPDGRSIGNVGRDKPDLCGPPLKLNDSEPSRSQNCLFGNQVSPNVNGVLATHWTSCATKADFQVLPKWLALVGPLVAGRLHLQPGVRYWRLMEATG